MISDGHAVKIVTATGYKALRSKIETLLRLFPMLSWDDIVITSKKQIVKGDVLIDDAPHNLVGGDYFKILITQPHNEQYDVDKNEMLRVDSLVEAYEAIKNLEWGRYNG